MSRATEMIDAAYEHLTDEWQSTQELAEAVGLEWEPGGSGLRELREALYWLYTQRRADHDPKHDGHAWKRAAPPTKEAA